MELEEGMYVRTQKGLICKLLGYDEKEKVWIYMIESEWFILYETFVKKTSHNIIDLIEVGDYVNGEKVFEVLIDRNMSRVKTELSTFFESDIKSIVTKEQFERMSYKVDEEDEDI